MLYLLMCCFEEELWEKLPQVQRDAIMTQYRAFEEALEESGHCRGGAKLGPGRSATTVRMQNGGMVLTDGPFTETKEAIGGYHLVECRDLAEAVAIAKRIPTLPAGGAVEVRPVESAWAGRKTDSNSR